MGEVLALCMRAMRAGLQLLQYTEPSAELSGGEEMLLERVECCRGVTRSSNQDLR